MKTTKIIWSIVFICAFLGGIFIGKSKLIKKNASAKIYSIGKYQADEIDENEIIENKEDETKLKLANNYLKIEDCVFMNMRFSKNIKLIGIIKDISIEYVFYDILLEATFYDTTGTMSLYSYRFYVEEPSVYHEFREIIELPSNIAKSNIGRVDVDVIDLKVIEKQ